MSLRDIYDISELLSITITIQREAASTLIWHIALSERRIGSETGWVLKSAQIVSAKACPSGTVEVL